MKETENTPETKPTLNKPDKSTRWATIIAGVLLFPLFALLGGGVAYAINGYANLQTIKIVMACCYGVYVLLVRKYIHQQKTFDD